MSTWFTSDQHFYHKNVISYCNRPFLTVDEMNHEIITRHNEVVKPTDKVWHPGDFSLSKTAPGIILPQLNGEHHLIVGNHDSCHPIHYKQSFIKEEKLKKIYYDAGFKSIQLYGTFEFHHGIFAEMCHFPYAPTPGETNIDTRYLKFRPVDERNYLLHGHVHEHWRKKGKMINVGVDQWNFFPVSVEQIQDLIAKGYQHNE